jgi:hypothetical protein
MLHDKPMQPIKEKTKCCNKVRQRYKMPKKANLAVFRMQTMALLTNQEGTQ